MCVCGGECILEARKNGQSWGRGGRGGKVHARAHINDGGSCVN